MNLVTGCAGNLILRMAALQAADMGRLIQVASQTDFVRGLRCEFGGIADVLSRCRFGMFLSRTVAGLAGLPFPTTLGISVYLVMRIPGERVVDILVTGQAGFGAYIGRRGGLACGFDRSHSQQTQHHSQIRPAAEPGHDDYQRA